MMRKLFSAFPLFVGDAKIALRNLVRQKRRTSLALLIIGGGTIAYLLAGGFIESTLGSMREATIHSQFGHIQITRPNYFKKGIADPYDYLLPEQSPEMQYIRSQPQVETLAPRLSFGGMVSHEDATISFIGEGVDPEAEQILSQSVKIVAGKNLRSSAPNELIMGEGLAANLGVKPGDSVVLLASTGSGGGANAVECKIAGLFYTTVTLYDDSALRLPIATARQLMRVQGATTWITLLKKTADTDKMLKEFRGQLPASQFELTSWVDLADLYVKTRTLFTRQVNVVMLIIGVIIILSISNTQAMAVVERTMEIGTVMSLGTRRVEVMRQFLVEGGVLGLIGGILGVAGGMGLARLISTFGIPMPAPPGMTRGFISYIVLTPGLICSAVLLALITTVVASAYPAWKASRIVIVDALRHNR